VNDTPNNSDKKLERVNRGKWWRMEHPDGTYARFVVTECDTFDKTPDNIHMRLEVYGNRVTDHIRTSPITRSLAHMRDEWNRLAQRGFVYNAD
jgi:hypothetical protein